MLVSDNCITVMKQDASEIGGLLLTLDTYQYSGLINGTPKFIKQGG